VRDSGQCSNQIKEIILITAHCPVVRTALVVLGTAGSPCVVVHGTSIIHRAKVYPIARREANESRNVVVALGEDHGAVGKSLHQRSTISHSLTGNVLVAVLSVSSVAHLDLLVEWY